MTKTTAAEATMPVKKLTDEQNAEIEKILVNGEETRDPNGSIKINYPTYAELGERYDVCASTISRLSTLHNCMKRRKRLVFLKQNPRVTSDETQSTLPQEETPMSPYLAMPTVRRAVKALDGPPTLEDIPDVVTNAMIIDEARRATLLYLKIFLYRLNNGSIVPTDAGAARAINASAKLAKIEDGNDDPSEKNLLEEVQRRARQRSQDPDTTETAPVH